jgi:hypothetical protein
MSILRGFLDPQCYELFEVIELTLLGNSQLLGISPDISGRDVEILTDRLSIDPNVAPCISHRHCYQSDRRPFCATLLARNDVGQFLFVDLEPMSTLQPFLSIGWALDPLDLLDVISSGGFANGVQVLHLISEVADPFLHSHPVQVALRKSDRQRNLLRYRIAVEQRWRRQLPLRPDDDLPRVQHLQDVVASDERERRDIDANGALATARTMSAVAWYQLGVRGFVKVLDVL